jgi:protein-tyrosine phosphatase
MVDIHTHILHDLDDGPATLEESLDMARAALEAGTHTVVATPHVLNCMNLANNSMINRRFKEFKALLHSELPDLKVLLGTEIYFQPNLSQYASYDAATLNGTRRYMLVEFPMGDIPKGYEKELAALARFSLVPVIAHPERNALIIDKPALAGKLVEAGAILQMNAGSLTGHFGSTIRKVAQILLKKGWVHVIASDAHEVGKRGPDLRKAVAEAAEIIGAAAAGRLVADNPRLLLEGKSLPGRPD